MVYANLSFTVRRPNDYRYFPPFKPGVNRTMNWELGHGQVPLWTVGLASGLPDLSPVLVGLCSSPVSFPKSYQKSYQIVSGEHQKNIAVSPICDSTSAT